MRGLTAALAMLMALAWNDAAGAQERGGQVLPPGQLRLSIGAESVRANSRFGDPASLAPEVQGPLTPATFAGAAQAADLLSAFLAATGGPPGAGADPSSITAGALSAELSSNYRYLPIRLGLGLLPRLEIVLQLPVYRTESLFTRFDLTDASVGLNTAPAQLLPILSRVGPSGAALAASPLLPLSSSPLGIELQKRVLALTGQNLVLPDTAVTYAQLASRYQTLLPASRAIGDWQPGDLEIEGRLEVMRTFDEPLFPDSTGATNFRVTAVAAARLPTGPGGNEAGYGLMPGVGYAGVRAGLIGDLFLGRSNWVNAGGMVEMRSAGDVVVFEAGAPFSGGGATILSRSPGAAIDLWIEPKRRLTQELAIGGLLRSEIWGAGEDELGGAVIPLEGGSRHSLGASVSYSTLATPEAERGLPLDASLGFTTSLAGSDGSPKTTVVFLQVSLLRRIWGGPN